MVEVVRRALCHVVPPMVEHMEKVGVCIDVCVGIHADEVGGGSDPGRSTVGETENVSAVASRTPVDAGNVDASRAVVVAPSPTLALGAYGLKNFVPALGGLKAGHTSRGVIAGRVDDGILSKDGNAAVFACRTYDGMVRAAMCSFADGSGARYVWPETGFVPSVQGASCVGGNGLPGGMGVPSFLHRDDGSVVVLTERSDGVPVGLQTGDVEADEVDGLSGTVSVRGAWIGPAKGV